MGVAVVRVWGRGIQRVGFEYGRLDFGGGNAQVCRL